MALTKVIFHWLVGNSKSFDDDTAQWTKMFEVVCAATADSLTHKPAVANGKYGFDGGVINPDCAEVTIQELFEHLLWNEIDAKYHVDRLPTTASMTLLVCTRAIRIQMAQYQQTHKVWTIWDKNGSLYLVMLQIANIWQQVPIGNHRDLYQLLSMLQRQHKIHGTPRRHLQPRITIFHCRQILMV